MVLDTQLHLQRRNLRKEEECNHHPLEVFFLSVHPLELMYVNDNLLMWQFQLTST